MRYVVVSKDTDNPIILNNLLAHLKLNGGDVDDIGGTDYFNMMGKAIADVVEKATRRDLLTTTYTLYLDSFDPSYFKLQNIAVDNPDCMDIVIERVLVQSIESIQYYDGSAWQTLSTDVYSLIQGQYFSVVRLNEGQSYPSDVATTGHTVKINFKAGYGDANTDIPLSLQLAMCIMYACLDQYRGDCVGSKSTSAFDINSNIPPQAQLIINQYKVPILYL